MHEQPDVLARLLARRDELVARIRGILPTHLAGITIAARGSSDHAALYGRYLLEMTAGMPAALAAPSIHTLYGASVDHRGWLAVGVSQSGETPDVVAVLAALRGQGATAVAVTNALRSRLAAAADVVIDLSAGAELAIPATKTVTAELMGFLLLAESFGPAPWDIRDLERVPEGVAQVLGDDTAVAAVADTLAAADLVLSTGRGYLLPVALEAALKLKEASRVHAEGYSTADLRHGSIVLASPGTTTLVFLAPGPAREDVTHLAEDIRSRGASVLIVGDDRSASVAVPAGLPEPLVAFPAVVRAQQIALTCARLRQVDPDRPTGLEKVVLR